MRNWIPTHQHIKTGGYYKELYRGFFEETILPVVVYQDKYGVIWIRSVKEFDDPERFAVLGDMR